MDQPGDGVAQNLTGRPSRRLSTAFAASVFGSPVPATRRAKTAALAVGSPASAIAPLSPSVRWAEHSSARASHSHFADLPQRHKDEHHDDVNNYFLNGPKASPLEDTTNDDRRELQWRLEGEQKARELEAEVQAQHAQTERERRHAQELQDKLRREEVHEHQLEQQLEVRVRHDPCP